MHLPTQPSYVSRPVGVDHDAGAGALRCASPPRNGPRTLSGSHGIGSLAGEKADPYTARAPREDRLGLRAPSVLAICSNSGAWKLVGESSSRPHQRTASFSGQLLPPSSRAASDGGAINSGEIATS